MKGNEVSDLKVKFSLLLFTNRTRSYFPRHSLAYPKKDKGFSITIPVFAKICSWSCSHGLLNAFEP